MRYYIDTEFIENGKTIDLISIGVVAEDGREFYAQNLACQFDNAHDWVKTNVLPCLSGFNSEMKRPHLDLDGDPEGPWYTRKAIAEEVIAFCDPARYGKPEFWGYYSAYDHVALCQIFGTMMELPQGWPMLTYDLRQFLDAKGLQGVTQPDDMPHHALGDARWIAETHQKVSKEGNVQSESRAASL